MGSLANSEGVGIFSAMLYNCCGVKCADPEGEGQGSLPPGKSQAL